MGNPIPVDHLQPVVIAAHAAPTNGDRKRASTDRINRVERHQNLPGPRILVGVVAAAVSVPDPTTPAV
jgi:hypothetical protein